MLPKRLQWLFYSHEADPFLDDLMRNADRALFFEEQMDSKALPKTQRKQITFDEE